MCGPRHTWGCYNRPSKYRNASQTCVCANRILVQDGVYDAFTKRLAATAGGMKVADGFEPGAVIGPREILFLKANFFRKHEGCRVWGVLSSLPSSKGLDSTRAARYVILNEQRTLNGRDASTIHPTSAPSVGFQLPALRSLCRPDLVGCIRCTERPRQIRICPPTF
jgi:hypothetical protein